ncbi:MAG: hypothetical protein AAGB34_01610 [Planctomycetota bacterium]
MFWKRKKKQDSDPERDLTNEHFDPAQAASVAGEKNALDLAHEAVVANPSRETELAFWREIFAIDSWHFIGPSAEDTQRIIASGDASVPLLTFRREDGTRFASVYSSSSRASDAMVSNMKERGEEQGFSTVQLSVSDALVRLCAMYEDREKPVRDAMFDDVPNGLRGYGTQAPGLVSMYNYFVGIPPQRCFGVMCAAAREGRHSRLFRDAYRMLWAFDSVWMAVMPDERPALVQNNDQKLYLPVFTDRAHADQFGKGPGAARIMPVRPEEFGDLDEGIRKSLSDRFASIVVNPMTSALGINIDQFLKALDPEQEDASSASTT